MKVMVAEYAVGAGDLTYLAEGKAMLMTLVKSFERIGHEVIYPKNVGVGGFSSYLEQNSKDCDCGLVISPDEFLYEYTKIVEDSTTNLGCPSESVRLCADKTRCSAKLSEGGVLVPRIFESCQNDFSKSEKYVIKPRFGCASEDIIITSEFMEKDGFITTEFLEGDHLSVSLVVGSHVLPITINKQIVDFSDGITYLGGVVPYETEFKEDILSAAIRSVQILGCKGYVGVDIVFKDGAYVVDVNPRATTSIVGVGRVIREEIGDLILRARFGGLPEFVGVEGEVVFEVGDF